MWRKLLRLRDTAKQFFRREVKNGQDTSFWYDAWSKLGRLKDVLGERGSIVMGISGNAVVADVLGNHRRRRHRERILNEIEDEIETLRLEPSQDEDIPLWKQKEGIYANMFSSKKTWLQLRNFSSSCEWSRGIWFSQSTPKYSFLVWVALRNRLQTCDRMQTWNGLVNPVCVLCNEANETCSHLFFSCSFSKQIWKALVGGILHGGFTTEWNDIEWNDIVAMVSNTGLSPTKQFLLRYSFQATVHAMWRERNARRHGEQPQAASTITKFVDKTIRLKLLMVKGLGQKYLEEGLSTWFGTRETNT